MMVEDLIKDLLLRQYSQAAEEIELISYSSKMVYKVRLANKKNYIFELFMKKDQEDSTSNEDNDKYFTMEAIVSEARILHVLKEKVPELKCPSPIANKEGKLLSSITVNGTSLPCLLRTYIAGVELVKGSPAYGKQAYDAGVAAAKLHHCSIQHMQSEYNNRPVHRQSYVQNIIETLRRGIAVGTITTAQYTIVKDALAFIKRRMDELDQSPDNLGIVHTDLRDANFLTDGETVIPIDFGRCVYGYLLYDLGEMCAHMGGDTSDILQIVKGYHSIRPLNRYDIVTIEAFKMLFILSVVAEFILQTDNAYVYDTLEKLTGKDLVHLLNGEPVIEGIRSIL
ncbi:phosphotransferase enzyme family protein [Paenibacillus montanisoli]|uniref:Aminoglycoside phosphotransferase domain-containing protein n=1 Tax=Paenibacillus montanisoli TaxID=2081970 RepID=A0A328TXP8_9BACL|nr:phosphotransferase [Paenibacillus montanisoli]RAP75239.1 hypothetical protein DL346_17855 [Paenibacillus montanisoli]